MIHSCSLFSASSLGADLMACGILQGEVYICGKKRQGLISDEELSGLRIGLVGIVFHLATISKFEL